MAWLSVDEYAKLKEISSTAVYNQIKADKLTTKKGDQNKTMILTDMKQSKQDFHKVSIKDIDKTSNEQIDNLKDFFNHFIIKLEESKDNEIRTLKDSFDKIEKLKDHEIDRLGKEIDDLKGKGFFKKLFGG